MSAAAARKAAWSAVKPAPASTPRTQDQKAAGVGEQALSGGVGLRGKNVPADVAKSASKVGEEKKTRPRTRQPDLKPTPRVQNLIDEFVKSQKPHIWD